VPRDGAVHAQRRADRVRALSCVRVRALARDCTRTQISQLPARDAAGESRTSAAGPAAAYQGDHHARVRERAVVACVRLRRRVRAQRSRRHRTPRRGDRGDRCVQAQLQRRAQQVRARYTTLSVSSVIVITHTHTRVHTRAQFERISCVRDADRGQLRAQEGGPVLVVSDH
jgi:hypothetical protein